MAGLQDEEDDLGWARPSQEPVRSPGARVSHRRRHTGQAVLLFWVDVGWNGVERGSGGMSWSNPVGPRQKMKIGLSGRGENGVLRVQSESPRHACIMYQLEGGMQRCNNGDRRDTTNTTDKHPKPFWAGLGFLKEVFAHYQQHGIRPLLLLAVVQHVLFSRMANMFRLLATR